MQIAAARPKAKAAVEQVFMAHQSSENCGGVMETGCDKLAGQAGAGVAKETLKAYAGQIEILVC
jgi:hypothetical protein